MFSQIFPLYPLIHVHENEFAFISHMPPFKHGLDEHPSSIIIFNCVINLIKVKYLILINKNES
jgi:hypothetical protein